MGGNDGRNFVKVTEANAQAEELISRKRIRMYNAPSRRARVHGDNRTAR